MWCAQAEEELTAIIRSATTSWLRTLLTQQLDEESDGAAPEEGVVDECADRLTTTAIEEIFKHFSLQARARTHAHAARAHDRRPVRPMLAAQYEATVQKWLDKNEALAAKVMQSVRARAHVGACACVCIPALQLMATMTHDQVVDVLATFVAQLDSNWCVRAHVRV